MKSVAQQQVHFFSPIMDIPKPLHTALEEKEQANLNRVIARAVRQSRYASRIILRMEELPELLVCSKRLQQAFGLVLHFMMDQMPPHAKCYCNIKCRPLELSLLDSAERSTIFYCMEIHTNAENRHPSGHLLLQEAAALLLQERIGFECHTAQTGGMLFRLGFQETGNLA